LLRHDKRRVVCCGCSKMAMPIKRGEISNICIWLQVFLVMSPDTLDIHIKFGRSRRVLHGSTVLSRWPGLERYRFPSEYSRSVKDIHIHNLFPFFQSWIRTVNCQLDLIAGSVGGFRVVLLLSWLMFYWGSAPFLIVSWVLYFCVCSVCCFANVRLLPNPIFRACIKIF
jgi:hypothetical protein